MTVHYSDIALSKDYGNHTAPKGVVLASVATFEVPEDAPEIGDTIKMNPVPEGAKILDVILEADGGTASLTLTVGDGDDADMFISSFSGAAAFLSRMDHAGAGAVGKEYDADGHIVVTVAGAAMTEGDIYTSTVLYQM
jgi:hypothetical protein